MERIRTTPAERPLDRILRGRSHVRVLRALVAHDGTENLTARDLARRAGIAHTSAMRVLPDLEATGIMEVRRVRDYRLYDLRSDHALAPALAVLFDDEIHLDEAIIAFVRQRGRERGRVVQTQLRRAEHGEAFLTLNGRGLEGFEAHLWVEGLRSELAERFGELVDVSVEVRRPSALRGLMD